MSAINVNSITGRTGSHGPVLTGVTTISGDLHVGSGLSVTGISTLSNTVVGGATTELVVGGDARITGILTIGTGSVTIDGTSGSSSITGVTTAGIGSVYGVTSINDLGYPSAGPLSNRNLIINGAMTVAERGTSETVTTNIQFYPSVDRMKIELGTQSSPNYTYSRDGDAPVGFTSSFKVLNNANTSQGSSGTIYHVIGQHVEQNVIDHLGWGTASPKPVTISFWVKSNVTGNDVIELIIRRNGTSSNDSIAGQITIDTADTWEYKTVTFPGTTTDIGKPASNALGFNLFFSFQGLVGGNKISSYGTWDNNNRLGGPAGDTNVFASTSGAYMNITGVQLEVGTRATPFEHRSYADELRKCQRYFEKVSLYGRLADNTSYYDGVTLGTGKRTYLEFKVEKRVSPSTPAGVSITNFQPGGASGTANTTYITNFGAQIYTGSNETNTAYIPNIINTNVFMEFDAEF